MTYMAIGLLLMAIGGLSLFINHITLVRRVRKLEDWRDGH